METFTKLFGSLLALVYHCFDRIVIQGYIPLLTRPEHIVHFFRDLHGIYPITKQALAKRTHEYRQWVEAFARNQRIPLQWPEKGVKKEDYVRPYCLAMERGKRFGVYFIFRSMEQGPTFRSAPPQFPTDDPDYRILKRQRSRYTHYYFYIRDEVLGPMLLCVGSFLPFQTTYYINGHHFVASVGRWQTRLSSSARRRLQAGRQNRICVSQGRCCHSELQCFMRPPLRRNRPAGLIADR